MTEATIREYAERRGFHPQTLERWLGWEEDACNALGALAIGLKASENHVRDIMDWLEEIALRDKIGIQEILSRREIDNIRTHPRLGSADKLKRIKVQLRRWRFPRLAVIEDSLAADIKALGLPAAIRLSTPPGLEGGRLKAEFEAATAGELKELTGRLREAAASEIMARIFAILAGKHLDDEQNGG
jgi:hypothetical protein